MPFDAIRQTAVHGESPYDGWEGQRHLQHG
jgi:hypothetical protein